MVRQRKTIVNEGGEQACITVWARLKEQGLTIRRDVHALYRASLDPRTPWYVKALAAFIVAYALSPIDLIPDFVPVLGYVDELILLPLSIALLVKLVPPEVMAEHRATTAHTEPLQRSVIAAAIIIAIWLALSAGVGWWVWQRWSHYLI